MPRRCRFFWPSLGFLFAYEVFSFGLFLIKNNFRTLPTTEERRLPTYEQGTEEKEQKQKHQRQTAELKTRTRGQQKRTRNGGGGDSIPSCRA
jgi:hypothetical protein